MGIIDRNSPIIKATIASNIYDVLVHNEMFLSKHDKFINVLSCTMELSTNDTVRLWQENISGINEYMTEPEGLYLTLYHYPRSTALIVNLLSGDVPTCYFQLRVMLESLACSYNVKHSKCLTSHYNTEKMLEYIESVRAERENLKSVMKNTSRKLGLSGNASFTYLWNITSSEYIRTAGFISRFKKEMKNSIPPAGSTVVPIRYCESDKKNLKKLGTCIAAFRVILDKVFEDFSLCDSKKARGRMAGEYIPTMRKTD